MTRLVFVVLIAGCTGGTPDSPAKKDAAAPGGDATSGDATGGGLVPGSLTVTWMHGAATCSQSTSPALQIYAYNATTYIIRQDKCRTFEAPFVYLLLGTQKALLLDTGATATTTLRETIKPLLGTRSLFVAHSHAHGDHRAADGTFSGQPSTTVVGTTRAAVQTAFGIATWPTDAVTYDLGDRVLDVLAIPGHEDSHLAIYDRQTGLLLTGDTLYPGLLFVNNWAVYRASISRLAQFTSSHPIAHVLGAHVEMTSTPKVVYPYGTTYQPAEHVLQLAAAQVTELDAALTMLGATPPAQPVAYDHFVIDPP